MKILFLMIRKMNKLVRGHIYNRNKQACLKTMKISNSLVVDLVSS